MEEENRLRREAAARRAAQEAAARTPKARMDAFMASWGSWFKEMLGRGEKKGNVPGAGQGGRVEGGGGVEQGGSLHDVK
jgi:hypothetical protein